MWYHLSRKRTGKFIVASKDKRADGKEWFCPRCPGKSHGERKEKRICVSPTVAQCLIGIPCDRGKFFIYLVEVKGPRQVDPEWGVADLDWTNEHWITDEIVSSNNGAIPIDLQGWVELTFELKRVLKRHAHLGELPRDAEEEKKTSWAIDGDNWIPSRALMD
jgi:hypothetical protein